MVARGDELQSPYSAQVCRFCHTERLGLRRQVDWSMEPLWVDDGSGTAPVEMEWSNVELDGAEEAWVELGTETSSAR